MKRWKTHLVLCTALLAPTAAYAGAITVTTPVETFELGDGFRVSVSGRDLAAGASLSVLRGATDVTGQVSLTLLSETHTDGDGDGVWETYQADYDFAWGSLPHPQGTQITFLAQAPSPEGAATGRGVTTVVPNVEVSVSDRTPLNWTGQIVLVVDVHEVHDPILTVNVFRNGQDVTSQVLFQGPEVFDRETAENDPSFVLFESDVWRVDASAVAQVGDTLEFRATVSQGSGSSQASSSTNTKPAQPPQNPECVENAIRSFLQNLDVRIEGGKVLWNGDPNEVREQAVAVRKLANGSCKQLADGPWQLTYNGVTVVFEVAKNGQPVRITQEADLVVGIAGNATSNIGQGKPAVVENTQVADDMHAVDGGVIAVGGDGGSGHNSGGNGGPATGKAKHDGPGTVIGGNGGDPVNNSKKGDGGDSSFKSGVGGGSGNGKSAENGFHGGGGYVTAYPAPGQSAFGNLGLLPNQ